MKCFTKYFVRFFAFLEVLRCCLVDVAKHCDCSGRLSLFIHISVSGGWPYMLFTAVSCYYPIIIPCIFEYLNI